MTYRTERNRLMLQIERDLASQAVLRTLLAAGTAAIADHRRALRGLKARIKRLQGPSR